MDPAQPISVFIHNYYGEHEFWQEFLGRELTVPFALYYNATESIHNRDGELQALHTMFHRDQLPLLTSFTLRRSSNRGKDIGGKLVLMDAYLKRGCPTETILLLHDKKSHYTATGGRWREKLLKVARHTVLPAVLEAFRDPATGIVAGKEVVQAGDAARTGQHLLQQLQQQYGVHPPGEAYVAGTMFWARAAALEDFFRSFPPLTIRQTLEPGNVLDDTFETNTHSWERLLSWLITARGYKLKAI
jgi:lipopolysaccharide biosynthesis protein